MNINVAGLDIEISGKIYPDLFDRLENYIVTDTTLGQLSEKHGNSPDIVLQKKSPDLDITITENNHIHYPREPLFGPYRGWHFSRLEDKIMSYRLAEGVDRPLIKIAQNDTAKCCDTQIELWNFEDLMDSKTHLNALCAVSESFNHAYISKNFGFVLHGSTIEYNGHGVIFSAKSGVGKSTHTSLWQTYYENVSIINDDTPAIKLNEGIPIVCGTPFAGSSGINTNMRAPLSAIVFLEQAADNSIIELSAAQAVPLFMNEIRKPILTDYLSRCLEYLDTLLKFVPIYLLRCNISRDACELVRNTLEI